MLTFEIFTFRIHSLLGSKHSYTFCHILFLSGLWEIITSQKVSFWDPLDKSRQSFSLNLFPEQRRFGVQLDGLRLILFDVLVPTPKLSMDSVLRQCKHSLYQTLYLNSMFHVLSIQGVFRFSVNFVNSKLAKKVSSSQSTLIISWVLHVFMLLPYDDFQLEEQTHSLISAWFVTWGQVMQSILSSLRLSGWQTPFPQHSSSSPSPLGS